MAMRTIADSFAHDAHIAGVEVTAAAVAAVLDEFAGVRPEKSHAERNRLAGLNPTAAAETATLPLWVQLVYLRSAEAARLAEAKAAKTTSRQQRQAARRARQLERNAAQPKGGARRRR